MIKKKQLIPLLSLLLFSTIFAQDPNTVLAEAGRAKITARDFKSRFELSPFVSKRAGTNIDSLKADFLYSMVTEKLWYLEGLDRGLDRNEEFRFYFNPVEDIFLRDALFKKEVQAKILLSAQDVTNTIFKAGRTLKTTSLVSQDSAAINDLVGSLKASATAKLDSLLKLPRFAGIKGSPVDINLGTLMDEEVEDHLFKLNPGEVSIPVRSEIGWVIFRIDNIVTTAFDLTDKKQTDQAKQTVKDRRAMHATRAFLKQLAGGRTINIDETAFKAAAAKIYEAISNAPFPPAGTGDSAVVLNDSDWRRIRTGLGEPVLQQKLFFIDNETVTVWDFLANLTFEEHRFTSRDRAAIYQKLSRLAKDFVQQQILTFEAKRQALQSSPEVIRDLEEWKQNMMAQMLKVSFLDSVRVSEKDIENYYRDEVLKDKDFLLVNILLLTVSDLGIMEKVINETSAGKTFESVIKEYGKTDTLVNANGETGLKPAVFLGDIGIIASKLNPGELYGPIKRGDGYSLLMVKEKCEMNDSLKKEFENSKSLLANYLFQKRLNTFMAKKTLDLTAKFNAKVYENRLKDVKTTGIMMFVHRLMGFGGRVTGTPLLDNWTDHVDMQQFKKVLLP